MQTLMVADLSSGDVAHPSYSSVGKMTSETLGGQLAFTGSLSRNKTASDSCDTAVQA